MRVMGWIGCGVCTGALLGAYAGLWRLWVDQQALQAQALPWATVIPEIPRLATETASLRRAVTALEQAECAGSHRGSPGVSDPLPVAAPGREAPPVEALPDGDTRALTRLQPPSDPAVLPLWLAWEALSDARIRLEAGHRSAARARVQIAVDYVYYAGQRLEQSKGASLSDIEQMRAEVLPTLRGALEKANTALQHAPVVDPARDLSAIQQQLREIQEAIQRDPVGVRVDPVVGAQAVEPVGWWETLRARASALGHAIGGLVHVRVQRDPRYLSLADQEAGQILAQLALAQAQAAWVAGAVPEFQRALHSAVYTLQRLARCWPKYTVTLEGICQRLEGYAAGSWEPDPDLLPVITGLAQLLVLESRV